MTVRSDPLLKIYQINTVLNLSCYNFTKLEFQKKKSI